MARFMVQASYTPEAWAALVKKPEDRMSKVNDMMASIGVRFVDVYYSFGEYDFVIITDAPDNKTAAGAVLAAVGGGALAKVQTTVLMNSEEGLEAMKLAGQVAYSPPGS